MLLQAAGVTPTHSAVTRNQVVLKPGQTLDIDQNRTIENESILVKGGTIDIGNGNSAGVTLTVAATSAIECLSGTAAIAGDVLLNQGSLTLGAATIDLQSLTNAGQFTVTGGLGTLSAGTFTNTGTLAIDSLLTFGAITGGETKHDTFINTGTIDLNSGGTLALAGTVATSSLAGIHETGGQLILGGTIENAGATLAVGGASNLQSLTLAGTLTGGTLAAAAGAVTYTKAVLDGVTLNGVLDLSAQDAVAAIENGITMTAGSQIDLTGFRASLEVVGNLDLQTGTLVMGLSFMQRGEPGLHLISNGATFTIGADALLTVSDNDAQANITGKDAEVLNEGTLTVTATEGALVLGTISLVNAGQIDVTGLGSGIFSVNPFSNSGTMLISNSSYFECGSLLNSGTIDCQSGSLTVFESLSNTGSVLLGSNGTLELWGAQTTASLAGIDNAHGGTIQFVTTLDNTGSTLTVGAGTALGTISFADSNGPPTILGGTIVDHGGGIRAGGGDGMLKNITAYDGTLTLASFDDLGVIGNLVMHGLSGNGHGAIQISSEFAVLGNDGSTVCTISNASITLSEDGTLGNLYGGPLSLAANDQTSVVGSGVLAGVVLNKGAITVSAGSTLDVIYSAGSSNEGMLTLAGGAVTDSVQESTTLTNTAQGLVGGFGTIEKSITSGGTINATGGTLTIAGTLSSTGTLETSAGATLLLTGHDSIGGTAAFIGQNATLGLQPMGFAATIAGYAPTDTITLLTTNATSASFVGNTIVVDLSAGGSLTLNTGTALTGTITVTHDTQGDSLLTYTTGNGTNVTPAAHAAAAPPPQELQRGWESPWAHGGLAAHAAW